MNLIKTSRSFGRKDDEREDASPYEKVLSWSYHKDIELFFTD
jgi:hypothetical protein